MAIDTERHFPVGSPGKTILGILGLCACVRGNHRQQEALGAALQDFHHWQELAAEAETHGLAPLVHHHLRESGVTPPREAHRMLQSLALRHARANGVRLAVLREILAAFAEAGVTAIALKGAALAHLLYPQPGLRPMRDLDLLVSHSQALEAQRILRRIGFDAPRELTPDLPHSMHHLSNATRRDQGLLMSVEVHHHLFSAAGKRPRGALKDFSRFRTFDLDGVPADSLGIEDLLGHLYGHSFTNSRFSSDLRLVNVADMVGLVEKYGPELDRAYLRQRYPRLCRVLPLLNLFTPLTRVPPPAAASLDYPRWPRAKLPGTRSVGQKFKDSLFDLLFPPRWWICFQYGLATRWEYYVYRWGVYPGQVLMRYTQTGAELLDRRKRQKKSPQKETTGRWSGR